MVLFLMVGFLGKYLSKEVGIQQGWFLKQRGTRGGGEIERTATVRYATECARLCMSVNGCNLYNLGPEDGLTRRMQCELVTRNNTAVDVSGAGADGWVMYVREGMYTHNMRMQINFMFLVICC